MDLSYWIALGVIIISYILYKRWKKNLWEKLGVEFIPPYPLFGNDLEAAIGTKALAEVQMGKYKHFGAARFGGTFMMSTPVLFVKDPNLVDRILTTDFKHFRDRGIRINEKLDPLNAHLFNLQGQRWKNVRAKLSPTFTSGKLKTMHSQLMECSDLLIEVLKTMSNESIDFRETMAKFTTDVIGACAYGLETGALKDPNSKFRMMGRRIFATSTMAKARQLMRQFLRAIHVSLPEILRMKFMAKDLEDFFMNLVKDTIRAREENNVVRNDFIQLLINLRKDDNIESKGINTTGNSKETVYLDDNMLAANSFLFFIAGFETTASTLSNCLFELSRNQELQEKVHAEIKSVMANFAHSPTYQAIKQMPLLDMCISETLRKYPPSPLLFRVCTEEYNVPNSSLVIPKGCRVEIPVYSLHHDPNIYPTPEEFKPERFAPEASHPIPKGAYLPFGDGPRICIGAKFAQMEMKVCLSKIISEFKVIKSPKMGDKLEIDPKSLFLLMPKGGIWLDIEKRE